MNATTSPPARLLRGLATLALTSSLLGCASTEEAGVEVGSGFAGSSDLETAPFVGRWTSELDGASLELEPTGVFAIDVPPKGAEPARSAVGRWGWNGTEVVFTNLRGSGACADLPGVYRAEVVRDTARFTLVRDECAPREEHMAWPWRRPAKDARRWSRIPGRRPTGRRRGPGRAGAAGRTLTHAACGTAPVAQLASARGWDLS